MSRPSSTRDEAILLRLIILPCKYSWQVNMFKPRGEKSYYTIRALFALYDDREWTVTVYKILHFVGKMMSRLHD